VRTSPLASTDRRTAWAAAFLVLLLVLLAILQYRWTGEVERAEEERTRSALVRAAWAVSGELEGELGRLYGRFAPPAGDLAEALPVCLAAWRATALEPSLLRGVLVARRQGEDWTLERWDEGRAASAVPATEAGAAPGATVGGLVSTDWPAELQPLRQRLA